VPHVELFAAIIAFCVKINDGGFGQNIVYKKGGAVK